MTIRILAKLFTNANILEDRRGATAIEYAPIASLISVAAVAAFETLGGAVENRYSGINQSIDGAL